MSYSHQISVYLPHDIDSIDDPDLLNKLMRCDYDKKYEVNAECKNISDDSCDHNERLFKIHWDIYCFNCLRRYFLNTHN